MKPFVKLLGSVVLAWASLSTVAGAAPYTSLVIFGDSLSDSGNNSNVPEIGANPGQVISGNLYVPGQTYGPAPFGTYSNGPVWASQFAQMLGLSALPSLAGGSNYAFGGATTSGGQVPSLVQQSGMFLGANPGADISNTLFVVAGGGNNARATFENLLFQSNFGAIGTATGTAASQYASDVGNIVDNLQAAGAQHIVVWNTPNIGLAPAIRSLPFATASGLSTSQLGSLVSGTLNGALNTRLAGETGVAIFDLYNLVGLAAGAGFTNTTDACGASSNSAVCPDISTALFWDGIHPTTAAHGFIASQMFALAAPVPEPSQLVMVVVGLLVVARVAARRRQA